MFKPANMLSVILQLSLLAGIGGSVQAATWCVNPGGTGGCLAKINEALSAAIDNDTIKVAPGTYKEDVIITKPVSLVGAGRDKTRIDAAGLPNGIYIDGLDYSGLTGVNVSELTVENAKFEGILIVNVSDVTIWNNSVINNDKNLNFSAGTCPGQPAFETSEDFDCGEGIHLIGVHQSEVAGNIVENNSGGILLSDETGMTDHNFIDRNSVENNLLDCGITMASHPPAVSGVTAPFGVMYNTLAYNLVSHNGVDGVGAGIGIFSPLPGGTVSTNVILGNTLTKNGLPGVAFHAHTVGANLNGNQITGNYIAGNGADTEDAFTPGTTGINVFGVSAITGTVIAGNVITDEAEDVVANTPAKVEVHLNDLIGGTLGVDNLGTGTVDATLNWWGCVTGPGTDRCASAGGPGVEVRPILVAPIPTLDRPADH